MKKLTVILALLGVVLIFNNLAGVFISLRNPAIYQEPDNEFSNDISLSQEQFFHALESVKGDREQVLRQITAIVNNGIAHYWKDAGINKYNLRIPFYENYILNVASYIYPKIFLHCEFMDYRRAVERGVGLCSQQSIILSEVVKQRGIDAKIVGLNGHVVMMALADKVNNTWWMLDPDYGVVIPDSLSEIEKNPDIIRPYYSLKGYPDNKIDNLVNIYRFEGNVVVDGVKDYSQYYFEIAAYLLIWVIPVLLILSCNYLPIQRLLVKNNHGLA